MCQISYNPAVALLILMKIWSIRFVKRKISVGYLSICPSSGGASAPSRRTVIIKWRVRRTLLVSWRGVHDTWEKMQGVRKLLKINISWEGTF